MRYPTFNLIAFFALIFCDNSYSQTVIRGPYLQLGTDTSMVIKWRTDIPTESKVWYDSNPTSLNSSVFRNGNRTDHEVIINNLTPATKFFYAIGDGSNQLAGGDLDHYFMTFPVQGSSSTTRVWVLGDAGWKNDNQRAVRDGYYNLVGNNHTDLVLLLGDNAYPEGTDQDFQFAMFENMYEAKLINSVWFPSPGNHDMESASSMTETGPYYEIFTCPTNGEAGGFPSGTEAFYSFDFGNIHFVSLDSDDTPRGTDDPMYQWLQNDLDQNTSEWIVAFWHHPPYSGTDSDHSGISTSMRTNFAPLFESYGVDLVLSGHTHNYQRSLLINSHYGLSTTFDTTLHGIDTGDGRINDDGAYHKRITAPNAGVGTVYIVAGSAGDASNNTDFHPAMYDVIPELGSLYFEVTGNQMDVKFVDVNSDILDYFTIFKNDNLGLAPDVMITAPENDGYYLSSEIISINADASDSDGNISNVHFFANGFLIGTDDSDPYELQWMPDDGLYELTARAVDNHGNISISPMVKVGVGEIKIHSTIIDTSDDAEERPSGRILLTSNDLDLASDGNYDQTIGMRFLNPGIPVGANITNCYIQFTVRSTSMVNPCILEIYGESTTNSIPFIGNYGEITGRPRTSESVEWQPPDWLNSNDAGIAQQTPNLEDIIEEIINLDGYSESSPITIIIDGIGQRSAQSFDGDSTLAAKLVVSYRMTCDSDGDGICDDVDICAGFDDNLDADGDGVPDGCDICAGSDDNLDADGDGVPDGCDICAGSDDSLDADGDGVPDGCDICAGSDDNLDADGDGVPDGCDICAGSDDNLDADGDGVPDGCDICAGSDDSLDADGDGVPDGCDICAGSDDSLDADDDGVPDGCDICAGSDDSLDADGDGVPDGCDICAGSDDNLDTDGDGVPDGCDICAGSDDSLDADGDGVPDGCDICAGSDDNLDADGDGVPDGCDICAGSDDNLDADGDGVPDGCDICAGSDDNLDADGDGVPDGCDICAGSDDNLDADGDGVPDGCDICAGSDDSLDADGDGVPDGCDICAGSDDNLDTDGDGVPDGCDLCAGSDDNLDADGDGVPDGCDLCAGSDDNLDADGDGVPDGCDLCAGSDDNLDADGDGVPDGCDLCAGSDDNLDADGDGVPDGCDECIGLHGSACPSGDCNIVGTPIISDIYAGLHRIFSQGVVATDSSVIFESAGSIELNPGFDVNAGATFEAIIIECIDSSSFLQKESKHRLKKE